MRTGFATVPLDYGKCPPWLFQRMKKLARGISLAIVEEFGPEEFLKRFSDPVWFQSFGCVLGFDWNSSGLTVTTLGALKEALFDVQDYLGVYVCGGKKVSRETPKEIETYGISRGFSFAPDLIYASRMAAKTDSSLIQDGYQIYQHNFLFTKSGNWAVVQQGMNTERQTARRYHWLSEGLQESEGRPDFVEEPHSGIICDSKGNPLNLTAKDSEKNRDISTELVRVETKKFLKEIKSIQENNFESLISMELPDKEFSWHPVVEEKFNLKRLEKTVFDIKEKSPKSFQEMVYLKGVGPRTVRALSLVAEIIYGAKPSYQDPARYTFSVGGKDGTPFPVDRETYDKAIEVLEKGIQRTMTTVREKDMARRRLAKFA